MQSRPKAEFAASPASSRDPCFEGFPRRTLEYLRAVRDNNNKEWFERHRAEYEQAYLQPAQAFVRAAGERLVAYAPHIHAEPKLLGSIFRIHRYTRVSDDKRPLKDYLDCWFWEGQRSRACTGFFVRISPSFLGIGVGCHGFARRGRLDEFRRAVATPTAGQALSEIGGSLRNKGYTLGGQRYKRCPAGYPADCPGAEFLLYDALFVHHDEAPEVACSSEMIDVCDQHWRALAPVHRWIVDHVQSA